MGAPVLANFDSEKEIFLESDTSSYIPAVVLFQYNNKGILYPVASISKKYSPTEENYEIYGQ
jgi:hypothetical protein